MGWDAAKGPDLADIRYIRSMDDRRYMSVCTCWADKAGGLSEAHVGN